MPDAVMEAVMLFTMLPRCCRPAEKIHPILLLMSKERAPLAMPLMLRHADHAAIQADVDDIC
jgi:hypothetical protein